MQTTQLHEDKFFKVLWDEHTRIIGIDWKEATSSMTDEDFKAALTLFAGHVEQKKAQGILVVVSPVSVPRPSLATERSMPTDATTTEAANWAESLHPARRIVVPGASMLATAIGPRKLATPFRFSTMPIFSAFHGTPFSSATSRSTARRSRKMW
jgi:hypothetical protein